VLLLANDASLPVRATYLTDAPGTGNFSEPVHLFNLNIAYAIAGFLALSAFFHLLVSSPRFFPRYAAGLEQHHNTFRWVEYSLSSSLMIVVILQLNGVSDFIALFAVFAVNASMILFGWLQERYTHAGQRRHAAVHLRLHRRCRAVDRCRFNAVAERTSDSTRARVRVRDHRLAETAVQLFRDRAVEAVPLRRASGPIHPTASAVTSC
jgi:hypothetical protein